MAQVNTAPAGIARQRAGVRRMKKTPLKIDMTPMVDLGFLLISFFVITAELSKPAAKNLAMPKDSGGPLNQLGESYALTLLLDGDKNYYYEKSWEQAFREQAIKQISPGEIRIILDGKQRELDDTLIYKEGRKGLMMLIKPSSKARYRTVVDMLDEAVISDAEKYALLNLSAEEKAWLDKRQ